jgi:hypothetical protein
MDYWWIIDDQLQRGKPAQPGLYQVSYEAFYQAFYEVRPMETDDHLAGRYSGDFRIHIVPSA